MAKFNRTGDAVVAAINSVVASLESASITQGTSHHYNNKDLAQKLGMESAALMSSGNNAFENYVSSMESIADHLKSPEVFGSREFLNVLGVNSTADIPAHSLEAAQIILAASGDLSGYLAAQLKDHSTKGVPQGSMEALYTGEGGTQAIAVDQSTFALESFDEKELNKYLNYSIVYNVMASRQDPLNALWFKPLTVTPDEIGYRVAIRSEDVWNGEEHNPNGAPTEFRKQKLIDALIHPEILDNNATEVIPFYQNGAIDNTEYFTTSVPAYNVSLNGVTIKTAPLKVGTEFNLLALSSHPSLIQNQLMGEKDSLDGNIRVKRVYLKVDGKIVAYDTEMFPRAGFYKSVEGHHREMSLNFVNRSFLATDGVVELGTTNKIAVFEEFATAGYEVRLAINLTGTIRTDSSVGAIHALPVRISSIVKDGREVPFDKAALASDAALKAIVEKLWPATGAPKIEVDSFDLRVNRTNYNLRTRGLLLDSTMVEEQITIPLRSPISINKPVVGPEKEYPDVKGLVNATRIQANNDGVATILNHARLMEAITSRKSYSEADRESFPGIGRHFLRPCFIRQKLHLPDLVNSVSSKDRQKDIQGAISTKINELVGRALLVTNYPAIVEQLTGGNPGKVKAIIATDPRLPQYLNIQGDVRLFGNLIDYEIETTPNKLMNNKVFISFSREQSSEGPDPFTYGTFVWTPELVVSRQMDRGSSTYHQHMVQPRYLHIVNIPILIEIEITGIDEVTGEQTVLLVSQVSAADKAEVGNKMPAPKSIDNGMGGQPKSVTPAPASGRVAP